MISISTKGRYGLRVLLDLAAHKEEGFIALKDIAERQGISKKYLEQIVPSFTTAGILRANRGSQGGYMLAKDPKEYTVGSVLRLTEGDLVPVPCVGPEHAPCERSTRCLTVDIWQGLYEAINNYLDSITLQDILDKNPEGNEVFL